MTVIHMKRTANLRSCFYVLCLYSNDTRVCHSVNIHHTAHFLTHTFDLYIGMIPGSLTLSLFFLSTIVNFGLFQDKATSIQAGVLERQ